MRIFLFLFFLTLILVADFNLTKFDNYHENICRILVDSSNNIDNYFIDENSTKSSKTEAELKTSFALETERNGEYAMRLRLRLNLPKIQKKFRLILEDEETDNPIYDSTTLNNEYQVENKNYFLRLEYFDYIVHNYNISSGIGVRFRKASLQPYANLNVRYVIDERQDQSALITNRLRVYADEDIENIVTYNLLERFEEDIYVLFHNVHRYQSWENDRMFVNSLSATKVLDDRREVTMGVALNNFYNNKEVKVRYPQIYGVYHAPLYKDWIYYELNPSLLWREENNYRMSARFMVNIGTVFETD